VQDGHNGVLWRDSDPRHLAALVGELEADRARLARLAAQARPSVVHRTWERLTHELLGHYQAVVAARRSLHRAS